LTYLFPILKSGDAVASKLSKILTSQASLARLSADDKISNLQAFRLTYFLLPKRAFFVSRFSIGSAKLELFFILTKFIFQVSYFFSKPNHLNQREVSKKRTVALYFFADCKDTVTLQFQPKYFLIFLLKNCEGNSAVFTRDPSFKKRMQR